MFENRIILGPSPVHLFGSKIDSFFLEKKKIQIEHLFCSTGVVWLIPSRGPIM